MRTKTIQTHQPPEAKTVGEWMTIETAKQSIAASKTMAMSHEECFAKLTEFAVFKCAGADVYCAIRTLRDATGVAVAA